MTPLQRTTLAGAMIGVAACGKARAPEVAASQPLAFVTEYACGDKTAEIGMLGDETAMRVDGKDYLLSPVETASGAKYAVAGAQPETAFWSKVEKGLLTIDGQAFPECVQTGGVGTEAAAEPVSVPEKWVARGQEPGWVLTIEGGQAEFSYAYGQKTHSATLPAPTAIEGGFEYREGDGGMTVKSALKTCADVMSGLPYPETVTVALGEEVFEGCGGDPGTLLSGAEWVVEDVNGGGVPDGARATLQFNAEESRVGGKTGCNSYGTTYTVGGAGLTFGDVMATEMACSPAVMDLEQKFLAVLRTASGHSFDESG